MRVAIRPETDAVSPVNSVVIQFHFEVQVHFLSKVAILSFEHELKIVRPEPNFGPSPNSYPQKRASARVSFSSFAREQKTTFFPTH